MPEQDEWLDRNTLFPTVYGFEEGAALLNDPRMKVEYHNLFSAAGACKGRAEIIGKRTLLNLNGEEHKRLRGEVAAEFRPRMVDRIRKYARATAIQTLQELPTSQPFDFMRHFAEPYIKKTTAEYIGFPLADLDALDGALALVAAAGADLHNRAGDFDAGCIELLDYAIPMLRDRIDNPTDDALGYLAQSIKSGAVDEGFAGSFVVTLLSAGLEPTIFQLGLMVDELSKLADVWNGVASGELEIALVLEELLRFRSTNQGAARCADAEVTQHGVRFRKDSKVIISIVAANHDPRRFACPDSFDVDANKGSHLAFGFGPHHCIGAALVRAQLQEALGVLAAELVCPEVVGVQSQTGQGLNGPLELIVEVERR